MYIWRKTNQKSKMNCVYVNNLDQLISKEELKIYFSKYGKVTGCEIVWLSYQQNKSEYQSTSNEEFGCITNKTIKIGKIEFETQNATEIILNSVHKLNEKVISVRSPFESELRVKIEENSFKNRICVFKVPKKTKNEDLAEIFKQFGPILKVFIKKTKYKATNHAFVTYLSQVSVLKALQQKKLTIMGNHELAIVEYKKKERKNIKPDGLKGGSRELGSEKKNEEIEPTVQIEKNYLKQRKLEVEEEKKNNFSSDDKKIKNYLFNQKQKEDFLKVWFKKIQLQNPDMKPIMMKNYGTLELFYHNKKNEKNSLINYNSIVKRFSKRITKNHEKQGNISHRRRRCRGRPLPPSPHQNVDPRNREWRSIRRHSKKSPGNGNEGFNEFYMIDNREEEFFKSRMDHSEMSVSTQDGGRRNINNCSRTIVR